MLLNWAKELEGSVDDEIVIDGPSHLEPLVVPEVQHVGAVLLPPVFPPVGLDHGLVLLTILVKHHLGGLAHTVCVEPGILGNIVNHVELFNLMINVINLLPVVSVVIVGVGPVVREPCQLGRVHEGGNSHCVGANGAEV